MGNSMTSAKELHIYERENIKWATNSAIIYRVYYQKNKI